MEWAGLICPGATHWVCCLPFLCKSLRCGIRGDGVERVKGLPGKTRLWTSTTLFSSVSCVPPPPSVVPGTSKSCTFHVSLEHICLLLFVVCQLKVPGSSLFYPAMSVFSLTPVPPQIFVHVYLFCLPCSSCQLVVFLEGKEINAPIHCSM